MKTCAKCGESKMCEQFSKDRSKRDGLQARCKECQAAYAARWYTENREKALANGAQWRASHREEQAEYRSANRGRRALANAKWRDANRERVAEYGVAYRESNQNRIREREAAYRAANKDRIAEYAASWRARNVHLKWRGSYLERARQYGFDPVVEDFTKADVIDRYGDACAHCGGAFEQLDHFPIPVVDGGTHTLDNVRPSCAACNQVTWRRDE